MKYVFPLVCGMIGSACAAMISIGTGVTAISIGVGGLPGILSIFPEYWVNFLLAMLTAIVVPFVLTIVVGSRKLGREECGLVTAGAPGECTYPGNHDPCTDHHPAGRQRPDRHCRRPRHSAVRRTRRSILAGRYGRRRGFRADRRYHLRTGRR